MKIRDLFNDIACDIAIDRKMNRRSASWKDVLRPFLVPQLCSLTIYRLSRYFYFKECKMISKVLRNVNVIFFGIDIQPEAHIEGGCFIGHTVGIVIGPHVTIKRGCTIFHGVTVTPGNHPGVELGDDDVVVINERVRIYAGAKVLGNLIIGSDVTIGANAVVLESVPSGLTVVGVPAKPLTKA